MRGGFMARAMAAADLTGPPRPVPTRAGGVRRLTVVDAPPTEIGGFVPAAADRTVHEIVVPLRQSTPDWTSMCWLPTPVGAPWQLCMLPLHHDKSCLPVPGGPGTAVR